MKRLSGLLGISGVAMLLSGCLATAPTIGDNSARTVATGSAGGSQSHQANSQLERCDQPFGTVAVNEDQSAVWWGAFSQTNLRSTVPVIRMLVQQSNCFVVVERGVAMGSMQRERSLRDSGEMRGGSGFEKGQMVAADFTLTPSVTFSQKGTGGLGAAIGGLLGPLGAAVAGGVKFNEASTMLVMVDNRSGVQLAAAEGSSRNTDFNLMGGLFVGLGVGARGYSDTPEGKLVVAAFADSYNQMVRALANYKAQEVKGGLGTGGRIGVQGGRAPAR